jgi:uncharacterized protein YcfJ
MIRRTALVFALALVAAGTASAQRWGSHDRYADHGPRWDVARVVNVDPILAPGEPRYREQCWQEPVRYVTRERDYDDRRYARSGPGTATSTVLGGIVGAAIGRQFGDGDGRRAATAAGALLGGAIANDRSRQREMYGNDGYGYGGGYGRAYERETVRYEQRCRSVEDYRADDRVVGYRVTYDYNGHVGTTTTSYHPGDTLRVRVDVTPEG